MTISKSFFAPLLFLLLGEFECNFDSESIELARQYGVTCAGTNLQGNN